MKMLLDGRLNHTRLCVRRLLVMSKLPKGLNRTRSCGVPLSPILFFCVLFFVRIGSFELSFFLRLAVQIEVNI